MKIGRIGLSAIFAACALLAFPACETMYAGGTVGGGIGGGHGEVHQDRGHGPPPHAPAHGHRAKHHTHGHDLEFDSGLGVYMVVGFEGVYYNDDAYFRWGGGGWEISASIGGPWRVASDRKVPRGLHKKHGGKVRQGHDEDHDDHPGKGKKKNKGRYR